MPRRRLCAKRAGASWTQLARPERDASGLGRHRQVLNALEQQLPSRDYKIGNATRDGRISGHDHLVARKHLLQQSCDFTGLHRRVGDQAVGLLDFVKHGARRVSPALGHCVRGGEADGRTACRHRGSTSRYKSFET